MKLSTKKFNRVLQEDVTSKKKAIFDIVSACPNIVPISLSEKQIVFCHCNESVDYYTASYKKRKNKVVCNEITKLDVDFNTYKNELKDVLKESIDTIISGKKPNNKTQVLEKIKNLVGNNENKLNLSQKVCESIDQKLKQVKPKLSRKTTVKIREMADKLKKDVTHGKNSLSKRLIRKTIVFEGKPVTPKGKVKCFEETFKWNLRRIKNLVEKKEFAKKLQHVYNSYINETDDFKTRVKELSLIEGIELLIPCEIAALFEKSAKTLNYDIDNLCGGDMIEKIHEAILKEKSSRIQNAIVGLGKKINENADMTDVVKGIRRNIFLTEEGLGDDLEATPEEDIDLEKIDAEIADETESAIDYTIEDVEIILDVLKDILHDVDPEEYDILFGDEGEFETEENGIEDKVEEVELDENINLIRNKILEEFEGDVVAVETGDIEDSEEINALNNEEADDEDVVETLKAYIDDLDVMEENELVDVEQLENIISFLIEYYETVDVDETEFEDDEEEDSETPEIDDDEPVVTENRRRLKRRKIKENRKAKKRKVNEEIEGNEVVDGVTTLCRHRIEWFYRETDEKHGVTELPESEEEHIEQSIVKGIGEGELNYVYYNEETGEEVELDGWWNIA